MDQKVSDGWKETVDRIERAFRRYEANVLDSWDGEAPFPSLEEVFTAGYVAGSSDALQDRSVKDHEQGA